MSDKLFVTYMVAVTVFATVTLVATAAGLIMNASWTSTAAIAFAANWAFILVTCIPIVYLHDRNNPEIPEGHHA